MCHVINILSTKVLSYLYAVCFGKAGFCKHCHVNKLDFFVGLAPSFTVQKVGLKLLRRGLVINLHFHKV